MAKGDWTLEEIEDLYNDAPCGYHSLDQNGVFIRINDTELRWLGYERHELIGKLRGSDLVAPESRGLFEIYFPRLKSEGSIRDVEFELVRKDGTRFPVLLSATAVRDKQGNFVMSRSIVVDMSEQRGMQDALRENEELFRRVFEEGPLGVAVVAKDHRYLKVNRAFGAMVGYEPREIAGKSFEEITHPEDRERDANLFAQVVRGEIPSYQLSKRYLKKDGETIWANLTRSVVRDSRGAPLYALSMIEDITERKQKDEALRESEERFRVALKNSPVVVCNQDRLLRYTWINSPILAWAQQDYVGQTDMEIVGGEEGLRLKTIKQGVLDGGAGTRVETTITFEGEKHYFDLTVEPMRDAAGKVQGVMCSAVDITPIKLASAQRERLIEELAQAQRELVQRNEELEYLNIEKTRWLGMAAHDVRNPLSAIVVQCELLLEDLGIGEEHRTILNSIYATSQFMLQLLDDVLDISQIESGAHRILREPVHLGSLVEESTALCRPLANRKAIKIETRYEEPTPVLDLDRRKMRQVFLNLIGNAIKYSQNGAVVQVAILADASRVLATVQDNGPGIPPNELESIFIPFRRTRAGAAQSEPGTGLGLAICKRIVESHGGKIWAENLPTGGAAFHVSLLREAPGARK